MRDFGFFMRDNYLFLLFCNQLVTNMLLLRSRQQSRQTKKRSNKMIKQEKENYKKLGFQEIESFEIENCTMPIVMDNGKLKIVDAINTNNWSGRYLVLTKDNKIEREFESHNCLISYCKKQKDK